MVVSNYSFSRDCDNICLERIQCCINTHLSAINARHDWFLKNLATWVEEVKLRRQIEFVRVTFLISSCILNQIKLRIRVALAASTPQHEAQSPADLLFPHSLEVPDALLRS